MKLLFDFFFLFRFLTGGHIDFDRTFIVASTLLRSSNKSNATKCWPAFKINAKFRFRRNWKTRTTTNNGKRDLSWTMLNGELLWLCVAICLIVSAPGSGSDTLKCTNQCRNRTVSYPNVRRPPVWAWVKPRVTIRKVQIETNQLFSSPWLLQIQIVLIRFRQRFWARATSSRCWISRAAPLKALRRAHCPRLLHACPIDRPRALPALRLLLRVRLQATAISKPPKTGFFSGLNFEPKHTTYVFALIRFSIKFNVIAFHSVFCRFPCCSICRLSRMWTLSTFRPVGVTVWRSVLSSTVTFRTHSITPVWMPKIDAKTLTWHSRWPSKLRTLHCGLSTHECHTDHNVYLQRTRCRLPVAWSGRHDCYGSQTRLEVCVHLCDQHLQHSEKVGRPFVITSQTFVETM